ncbi:Ni/Fe-hydrogenase, b-type cytochrome subunit [Trichlorobacter ammonificans]|uniref:[NiFe] hydrogenase, cytochrome b subunit n=1 Tax=Trichlorobacter ammonificans TaxID=2916410 RepID=A0ABM9D729_9BACT|nr:Ni/Fe-hydrogenase, b-type cytochrome subunit [Trichlorobacter ammonificans]CAH2031025.1 [NiFe] hydrogenase, cytochrome b subunit [Trichlorobacter ammonificans]
MKEKKYKQYIWELPVRISHWINVISIVVLSATGILIGNPSFIDVSPSAYLMGWIRFLHFVFGYALAISVISRMIWAFRGNCYAGWREYFPFLCPVGRKEMKEVFAYYTFRSKHVPEITGHNPMAATAYFFVFLIYWFMILTGFAMYAEHAPGGPMHALLKPVYLVLTTQQMHLYHHVAMYLLIGFVINHIYSAWLMDIKEKGGEISSIFSGYKFTSSPYAVCKSRTWELFPWRSRKSKR